MMAESSQINNNNNINNSSPSSSSASSTNNDTNDEELSKLQLAKETLNKFINNREEEALEIFQNHNNDVHMYAGYFTAKVIDALMTLEDDKLTSSIAILKDAEKICKQENGWFDSIKLKMYGGSTIKTARYMESQIILADSYMLAAALIFMQQDLSGYFKGGWILRKAWRQYQDVYADITKLYNAIKEKDEERRQQQQQEEEEVNGHQREEEVVSSPENEEDSLRRVIEDDNKKIKIESNGYIDNYAHAMLNNTFVPKQSASCHDNLVKGDSYNGLLTNSRSESSHSFSSSSTSSALPPKNYNNTMKKSSSVNSALSKHINRTRRLSDRLFTSSFGSNVTLSYFTSTFNLFTTDKFKGNGKKSLPDDDTVKRLMGAVSFGYGLLQLGISLLPPALIKITNILGFHGNRQAGVNNLLYARLSTDMRAPLATLALLWYHTIVRPFYAFDGNNVQAGVEVASQLIDESNDQYGDSALFLFFKGRVYRLNSNIDDALRTFQTAVTKSNQREVKLLSMHEIGWCQMIQLMFKEANDTFVTLKTLSRWSRAFYTYVSVICSGASAFDDVNTLIMEFSGTIKTIPRGTQLDVFLCRRQNIFTKHGLNTTTTTATSATETKINDLFYKMLIYELLYLWNTLPSCNDLETIINDCVLAHECNNSPMIGLSRLIEASCYCLKNERTKAIDVLRGLIDERKDLANNVSDAHVSAFANYELGLLLVKEPELKADGIKTLQKVLWYKGYDFEQRLEVRVTSLIKRYQHEVNVSPSPTNL